MGGFPVFCFLLVLNRCDRTSSRLNCSISPVGSPSLTALTGGGTRSRFQGNRRALGTSFTRRTNLRQTTSGSGCANSRTPRVGLNDVLMRGFRFPISNKRLRQLFNLDCSLESLSTTFFIFGGDISTTGKEKRNGSQERVLVIKDIKIIAQQFEYSDCILIVAVKNSRTLSASAFACSAHIRAA